MWPWFATMPSTNVRIAVTILLAVFYVLCAVIGDMNGNALDDGTLYAIGGFLTIWAGLDVTQFTQKRKTDERFVAAAAQVAVAKAATGNGGPSSTTVTAPGGSATVSTSDSSAPRNTAAVSRASGGALAPIAGATGRDTSATARDD